jgi:hypothetical protein
VARASNVIVGAADRMLTAGDIQFEPSAGTKLIGLSKSLFVMTAGDSALQAEILSRVIGDVTARIQSDPDRWWYANEVSDLYVRYYNEVRNKRAENQILAPFGLTPADFHRDQRSMNDQLVNNIATELINYELPSVATIVAGLDPDGPHIYAIYENEPNCLDGVAFAAVGIGHRHATSQFMFARHAYNAGFPDTLMLTYYAKRKAEAAPGVGTSTDMAIVGPGLNTLTEVGPHVIKRLDQEYSRIIRAETAAFTRAKEKMRTYVDELTRQAQATAAAAGGQQAAPQTNGGNAPADQTKA